MFNQNLGNVIYEGVHCLVAIERLSPQVIVLRIEGWDAGELGDTPMLELAKDLEGAQSNIKLFIDARAVKGATIEVSADWAQWLAKHRDAFEHISMLTGSRFIQLTANFVRRFAELTDVMRIYTDEDAFDAALAEAIDDKIT